ncbi:MAG: hypothetical protein KDJ69_02380, partial [Nitratireductor sp.]|nr:hypothetical protein [Nitratireductor sp.]
MAKAENRRMAGLSREEVALEPGCSENRTLAQSGANRRFFCEKLATFCDLRHAKRDRANRWGNRRGRPNAARSAIAGERPVLTFKAQRLYIRANAGVPPANGIVNGLWRALFCQKEQMFS